MGVILVREGNSVKQQFLVSSDLITEKTKYRDVPFVYGIDRKVKSFPITIAKVDENNDIVELTYDDRVDISRWLCPDDNFHEFITEDFPEVVAYVYFNQGEFNNISLNKGYITLNATLNAPYVFSPMTYSEWDLSDNTTSTFIDLANKSNILSHYTPNVLEFTLVGTNTNFKLINHSNGGKVFEFTGLTPLETVSINSNQHILSSTGNERITNFNFGFDAIELVYGINRIEVFGKCILKIKQQFPMTI